MAFRDWYHTFIAVVCRAVVIEVVSAGHFQYRYRCLNLSPVDENQFDGLLKNLFLE